MGWIAVLYCGARTVGKLLGVACGAKQANAGYSLQRYGGCGLLAQGSVAVGLALLVLDKDQQLGQIVSTTIFSSIIIIEILGPLAVRWSIVKSGEVKIINLIHRDEGVPFREFLKDTIIRLRTAFGIPLWKNKHVTDEILVEHIMRKHIEAFHEEIHFDQILKVIEHSRYNLFPVINKRDELTGMISFKDIGNVLYDEMMKDLVIAKDIANPTKAFIRSKDTISEALDLFEREKVDILPSLIIGKQNIFWGSLPSEMYLLFLRRRGFDTSQRQKHSCTRKQPGFLVHAYSSSVSAFHIFVDILS